MRRWAVAGSSRRNRGKLENDLPHRTLSDGQPMTISEQDAFAEMALLVRSFQFTKMLQIAAAIDLADRIAERPKLVADLAGECGVNAAMLLRLCRALSAYGVFALDSAGTLSQTSRSAWLRRNSKPTLYHTVRYWGMPSTWAALGNLDHTVRTGESAFEAVFGMPMFEYLRAHPDDGRVFDLFMEHSPDDRHRAVVDAYDFSDAELVVDVAGGNGALLAVLLEANTRAKGLLFDQENVVADAPHVLGTYADRCSVVAGDFLTRVPSGGDVYILSQILHTWPEGACLKILANCRSAMSEKARLLLIERVLDELPGTSHPMSFLSDMQMMAMFPDARERTFAEYEQLLGKAGFEGVRLIPTRSSFSVVESRPAH
jgi:hypothetical protein